MPDITLNLDFEFASDINDILSDVLEADDEYDFLSSESREDLVVFLNALGTKVEMFFNNYI